MPQPVDLPQMLTAGNAQATVRAVLAAEGYMGPFDIDEGPGWVRVFVDAGAPDAVISGAFTRLRPIVCIGVDLRVTRYR